MAALIFLVLIPAAVMVTRFHHRRPGTSTIIHAQLAVFAGLLLLATFMLPFFAVGPERALSNPHHGIGVAIFVLFILEIIGGRLVRHINKLRSFRITIHQWCGRAIALLGIIQVPLGLTLYGSPKYLFILYALWMTFLLVLYFILDYRTDGRRELYMSGGRSEAGRTQVTESEYFSERRDHDQHGGAKKWLGPLAAGAGVWALMRGRKKDRNEASSRGGSPSFISDSRGPEVLPSRRGSHSFVEEKSYRSESPDRRKSGGGFMKVLGGAAAAVGAGKLVSGFMNRRDRNREDEYSAVSTETPRRNRLGREGTTMSEFDSDMTPDYRRNGHDGTQTSLLPPSATAPAMAAAMSAANPRMGSRRPVTPPQSHRRHRSGAGFEESDYSSYVSPSRRPQTEKAGGGLGKGILAGLGMGWLVRKLADRRARKEEANMEEDDDMRSGTYGSRYTGDVYPSTSRVSRPTGRRPTGHPTNTDISSQITESSVEPRPTSGTYTAPRPPAAPASLVPGLGGISASQSKSKQNIETVAMPSMPPMPPQHQSALHSEADSSFVSSSTQKPKRRASSRRRRAGDRAAAAAAARASELAVDQGTALSENRDQFGSPHSGPVSVKLKMHDDRDRNVTLRRLTEQEAMAARGPRSRDDSESSLSALDSPSNGRRYRRESAAQRRPETAPVQQRVELTDNLAPLSPPNPAFAKGRRAQKDSAYFSGQPGPSGITPAANQTMSSLASLASPDSHGTWSQMSPSPSGAENKPESSAAADNRRRRRLERRRGSSSATARPSGADMFD